MDHQDYQFIKGACDAEHANYGVIKKEERGSFYVSHDHKSLIISKKAKIMVWR